MTFVSQPQAGPVDPVRVSQVIASYAAYLHASTHLAPETTVAGDHAQLNISVGDKTLVLTFHLRSREWTLHKAELRRRGQTATFTRGELAEAVAALLRP